MNKPESLIAAIIIFFVALFVYTKLAGPIPLFINSIQTTKTDLFQAQGTGKVTQAPNTAVFSFGVTKQATTVLDAQNQTNSAVSRILDAIKSLGIDEKNITTTDYSVNPNYNYANNTQTVTGYTVNQTVQVKISPIDKASKAIDIATQNGANIIDSLSFTLDDQSMKQLNEKARAMAIDNAKQNAQSLASLAGMKLGRIINVQENLENPTPIRFGTAPLLQTTAQQNLPTQLPTGQTTVSTTVTLSYETY